MCVTKLPTDVLVLHLFIMSGKSVKWTRKLPAGGLARAYIDY